MAAPLDIGESLVGAYLRYVAGCDFVVYGTQTERQGEIDVIGFEIAARRVRLCEVATHLDGLLYGNGNADTLSKIRQKTQRAAEFAASTFEGQEALIEWWSPKADPALVTGFQEPASANSMHTPPAPLTTPSSAPRSCQASVTRSLWPIASPRAFLDELL